MTSLLQLWLKSILAISFTLFSASDYAYIALAQSKAESIRIRFMAANSGNPDSRGTPPTENGTGSRGNCPVTKIALTSLVGSKNLSLTVSEHPTFWFYVPYTVKEASNGEFFLQDQQENTIYKTQFVLPDKPGIMSIRLPSDVKPIQSNQNYRWYLSINCSSGQSSDTLVGQMFLTGQIQRILLTDELKRQLNLAQTPLDRVQVYAQNGIWYDTLTEFANLYRVQPTLATTWTNLLKDVGLESIAQVPIVK